MKLGTENKTKTAIAAGLLLVAGFAVYNGLSSGNDSTPTPTATKAATPTSGAAKPTSKAGARKTGPVMLAIMTPAMSNLFNVASGGCSCVKDVARCGIPGWLR